MGLIKPFLNITGFLYELFEFELTEQYERAGNHADYEYPELEKTLGDFLLMVDPCSFRKSEIVVMLGENGTGKTKFVKMFVGLLESYKGNEVPENTFPTSPRKLLQHSKVLFAIFCTSGFEAIFCKSDVVKPMKMEEPMDRVVNT